MYIDTSDAMAKVNSGDAHLQALRSQSRSFLGSQLNLFVSEYDPEANRTLFRVGPMPAVPEQITCLLGDAVHNYRSALDFLAFALFRESNPTESGSHIYFPISENKVKYDSEKVRKTKGIRPELVAKLDSFHPYGGANNTLWSLHHLDIVDKHQMLVPVAALGSGLAAPSGVFSFEILSARSTTVVGEVFLEAKGTPDENKSVLPDFEFAFRCA